MHGLVAYLKMRHSIPVAPPHPLVHRARNTVRQWRIFPFATALPSMMYERMMYEHDVREDEGAVPQE